MDTFFTVGNTFHHETITKNGKKYDHIKEYDLEDNLVREWDEEIPYEPKDETPQDVRITREDFDLLDVTKQYITYYITEEDGTVTIRQGED